MTEFGKWNSHMGKAAGNDYQEKKNKKTMKQKYEAKSLVADPFDITMVTRK